MKQTNLEKYGVEYISQTNDFKNNVYNSKLKNKTYTKSKSEEEIYKLLQEKYGEVKRQYAKMRSCLQKVL